MIWPDLALSKTDVNVHFAAMLYEMYVEALLVDEDLADQDWEAWDAGEIDDAAAIIAWWAVALGVKYRAAATANPASCGKSPSSGGWVTTRSGRRARILYALATIRRSY